MRIRMLTCVDITQTDARKGDNPHERKQQQNFLTAVNTISLRANPIVDSKPVIVKDSKWKNEKVWQLDFSFENDSMHSLDLLIKDFNYVPIITGLDETLEFTNDAFITENGKTNTKFIMLD